MLSGAINKSTKKYMRPDEADKKEKFLCIGCKKDVILRSGKIRIKHFAHRKENSKCNFFDKPSESEIHKNAKLLLKYILEKKIDLTIHRKCDRCNKIDTYEIPKITDKSKICLEYVFDYNGKKIADVAYIDDNKISYIFEICHTHKTQSENRPEPWFEFDATKIIEIINSSAIQSIILDCIRTNCNNEECNTEYINNKCINEEKGVIYFNQRGAGCGKTYESIQLLQNKFPEKETYIYLTKMHSVKEVIYNELKDQESRGALSMLQFIENDVNGKQYKISYYNKESDKNILIIIGTIDSFNYAIVNKNEIIKSNDYFKGILKTIVNGSVSITNNNIKYSGKTIPFNKKCLIIIDEAQDLCKDYIEAFNTIITPPNTNNTQNYVSTFDNIIAQTNIDVYVIGDKLQSIWGEHNIHTYINKNDMNTRIERNCGENIVKRFHNEKFIEFVNDIVPFEKYELPPIIKICDGKCKYNHENEKIPYTIFEVPKIYANDYDEEKIDNVVKDIINYMDTEINNYNYLPNNFMFIFPILSKNAFARTLETRIQQFWIDKFKNIDYQENVLKLHEYWKNKINDNKFHKYIYLHKSDEGRSINLKESENATRILSIHASKGNGCEVVFLLGVSEKVLTCFSKKKCNLVYESLLHVAITRQKKSIYIGIEENDDDIHNRFKKFNIIKNETIEPKLKLIKTTHHCRMIRNYMINNDDIFSNINRTLIEPNNCMEKLPMSENKTDIIDWGHHVIRYGVMIYYLMMNIIENDIPENDIYKNQFTTIIKKISKLPINIYTYFEYAKILRNIDDHKKSQLQKSTDNKLPKNILPELKIPLLLLDASENSQYHKYTTILKNIMENIQLKIKKYASSNIMPPMCSFECIVLLFMIKTIEDGSYSDISIMDLYSIMYCYDSCSDTIGKKHSDKYECLCKKYFIHKKINDISRHDEKIKDMRKSILNHFKCINQIKKIYDNYKKYVSDTLNTKITEYHFSHHVHFRQPYSNVIDIRENHMIIGNSDTHVIFFIIKPQFNILNFYDVIFKALMSTFMILNVSPDCNITITNYERFNGKKLYACILTFDSCKPIFYELNIERNNTLMTQSIKEYSLSYYSQHHELVYRFYTFCREQNLKNVDRTRNSIEYTLEKLENYFRDHRYKPPKYILDMFNDIRLETDKCIDDPTKIRIIMDQICDEERFAHRLNMCLEKSIDQYLGISAAKYIDF